MKQGSGRSSSAGPSAAPTVARSHSRPRSTLSLVALALAALFLFLVFVGLGSWQIKRLNWKLDLIAHVDQRVHAPPSPLPPVSRWTTITAAADEYRHVRLQGVLLEQYSSRVRASTVLGRGYWLMTPLQQPDGSLVFINRGFLASERPWQAARQSTPVTVTGLLRLSETHGGFLQTNDPAHQQWSSRDVGAMAASFGLQQVAPFFIDAQAADGQPFDPAKTATDGNMPVPGLTVIAFNNNHLVYTLTWFALALMIIIGSVIIARAEISARRGTPQ